MAREADLYGPLDTAFADFLCRLAKGGHAVLRPLALALSRATAEGHLCLPLAELVSPGELAATVTALAATGVVGEPGGRCPLILDRDNRLYLYRYWQYERELAAGLLLRAGARGLSVDEALLADGLRRLFGPLPAGEPDWQRIAAAAALWSRFCVISGGPGTGKTTTVVKILALLLEQGGPAPLRMALAAPTGKAAARLSGAIHRATAGLATAPSVQAAIPDGVTTIHRLLGVVPGTTAFRHHGGNPLPFDLVVIDEASMVSLPLMARLVAALPPEGRLLLLGDRDQLSSVEPGAVLGDICGTGEPEGASPGFRRYLERVTGAPPESLPGEGGGALADSLVVLRRNFRFAAESAIGRLSRAINAGDGRAVQDVLEAGGEEVSWRELPGPAALAAVLEPHLVAGYGDYLAEAEPLAALAAFERFRVLCALRQGRYGVAGLNSLIERVLAGRGLLVPRGDWYRGRPVLITVNDHAQGLFNGDTGIALPDPEQPDRLAVWFADGRGGVRPVAPLRLPCHETAFAVTVHKSQGSEFEGVLLVLPGADSPVLTRELLYTGVTRARQRVELWGDRELLARALTRRVERRSGLGSLLRSPAGP